MNRCQNISIFGFEIKRLKMILIADSGSSKTDWALVKNGETLNLFQSKGINPFFITSAEVYQIVKATFEPAFISDKVEKIYFYGAGCIKNHNSDIIIKGLSKYFINAIIEVEDDMIGAARSLFGNNAGIACILGTGANSCKFDGKIIIEKISALGYILGDEGSGAYLGKNLINNYFKKIMPEDLAEKFRIEYGSVEREILNNVYKQPYANNFLAKFTYFLSNNINHPYVQELLSSGFEAFIENNILKYTNFQNFQAGFVGSIAYHFSAILKKICLKYKIEVAKIIEKPIDGLIQYHLGKVD